MFMYLKNMKRTVPIISGKMSLIPSLMLKTGKKVESQLLSRQHVLLVKVYQVLELFFFQFFFVKK